MQMVKLSSDTVQVIADRFRVKVETVHAWARHGAPVDQENPDFTAIEAWLSSSYGGVQWVYEFLEAVVLGTDYGYHAKVALNESATDEERVHNAQKEFVRLVVQAIGRNPEVLENLKTILTRTEESRHTPPTSNVVSESCAVMEDAMADRPTHSEREPDEVEVVHISPLAFLKSMLAIVWCCLSHPFSRTLIDVTKGEVIHVQSEA
jgi:hypothetical protein